RRSIYLNSHRDFHWTKRDYHPNSANADTNTDRDSTNGSSRHNHNNFHNNHYDILSVGTIRPQQLPGGQDFRQRAQCVLNGGAGIVAVQPLYGRR
ncbi:MAG: hypothetical protein NC301_08525, partial [Bacteroides sp.]|nr:hypothetical protein [Bacteroides sp.]